MRRTPTIARIVAVLLAMAVLAAPAMPFGMDARAATTFPGGADCCEEAGPGADRQAAEENAGSAESMVCATVCSGAVTPYLAFADGIASSERPGARGTLPWSGRRLAPDPFPPRPTR